MKGDALCVGLFHHTRGLSKPDIATYLTPRLSLHAQDGVARSVLGLRLNSSHQS